MSASSSGIGVGSASAAAGGYSGGGAVKTSRSGDVVRNVANTVGRGGKGKSTVSNESQQPKGDGADGGGEGTAASKGKKRVAGPELMPKNVPDELSKRNPPDFEDTHGRKGAIKTQGARLAKVNEADRDPDVQPSKRSVLMSSAPKIQIENRLTHTRVTSKQKMCTYGSHRRSENWTHGYRQQTKGPFSDHLPFKTRNSATPSGVGSNLGV